MSEQPPQGPPPQAPPPQAAPPQAPVPPVPPAGPPTYAPSSPPANFKSGKVKTIGLIVAGVVAAGVIGGIVGVALGGGDDDKPSAAKPGTDGSGILNPKPVGNVSPAAEPGDEPTDEPAPSTEPEPTDEPGLAEDPAPVDEPASGDAVTIGGVVVPVPNGWEVTGDVGADDVSLAGEDGSWAYALAGAVDPTSDAASLLTANLETFLPADGYSQLSKGEIAPIDPFGSVVSGAVMDYQGLWVDTQGSTPVYGRIYVAIRQDGAALMIGIGHSPPEEFDSSADWGQLVDQSYSMFGGS